MEGNIPSEISQTKTSIACFHLQQIKKKKNKWTNLTKQK